jgi:hypothetical protein
VEEAESGWFAEEAEVVSSAVCSVGGGPREEASGSSSQGRNADSALYSSPGGRLGAEGRAGPNGSLLRASDPPSGRDATEACSPRCEFLPVSWLR